MPKIASVINLHWPCNQRLPMQIYVSQLWPKPRVEYDCDFNEADDWLGHSLLYVPIPRWATLSQLDNQIYELARHSQRSFSGLILRAHKHEAEYLLADTEQASLIAERIAYRLEGLPVWVLHWANGSYQCSPLSQSSGNQNSICIGSKLINLIRQAEMISWTRQPGALLPPVAECHYAGPNGSHYGSFLRVGVITRSIDVLDSMAFWLLPHILENPSSPSLLLLDSWTILSVGLNVNKYIQECGYKENGTYLIECLRDYDEDINELLRRLECLSRSGDGFSEILLIVSVSSSMRLASRLLDACTRKNWRVRVVSLYSSYHHQPASQLHQNEQGILKISDTQSAQQSRVHDQSLCILGDEFKRYDRNSCVLCTETKSPVVRIQPSTYLLESTSFLQVNAIGMADVKECTDFFGRYSGTGCVSVHRNQHDDGRHHMIHIDVAKLLETEDFRARLATYITPLKGQIDVILCPEHDTAVSLAIEANKTLGLPLIICDQQKLGTLPDIQRQLLMGTRIILIDDVVITGQRLRGYRKFLREGNFVDAKTTLHLLVGVARPESTKDLGGIKEIVHAASNFHAVEQLLLPNWGLENCPWCDERNRLDRAMENTPDIAGSEELSSRFNKLGNLKVGLQEELFLYWSSTSEGQRHFQLGAASIFTGRGTTPLSQVELFVSVVSAIQCMRNTGKLNMHFTTPVAKVIDPKKITVQRYYDQVIPASVLRAANVFDLRATKTDLSLIENINLLLKEQHSREFRSELLFGVVRGHIPRAVDDGLVSTALNEGERGVCGFLSTMLVS